MLTLILRLVALIIIICLALILLISGFITWLFGSIGRWADDKLDNLYS